MIMIPWETFSVEGEVCGVGMWWVCGREGEVCVCGVGVCVSQKGVCGRGYVVCGGGWSVLTRNCADYFSKFFLPTVLHSDHTHLFPAASCVGR